MQTATNPDDGVRVAYQTMGGVPEKNGPPLLLGHGSALTHSIWRAFGYVRALRDRRTLILVDMRGHGRSDKPHDPASYEMSRVVGDLVAVLDDLGIEEADYFGYSFGGRAGLSLAAAAPDRVRSMIIGAGSHLAQHGIFDRLFFPGCIDVLETEGMEAFLAGWNAVRLFPVDSGTRAVFSANDSQALAAYLRQAEQEPGLPDDALRAMTLPSLFFVGSQDTDRLDDTRAAAALVPGSELHVIRGFDHSTALAAAPEVLEFVTPFLNRVSPSTAPTG